MDNIDYSLFKGYVMVIFRKIDRSYRRIVGTTNKQFIPVNKWPVNMPLPWDDYIRFFDLEESEWKSLKKINLIGLVKLEKKN